MAGADETTERKRRKKVKPFRLAGWNIEPGTVRTLEIRLGELYNAAPIGMRTVVFHGKRPGPRLWISGGVHGDELAGMAAVRHALHQLDVRRLRGTLVAIPCVNELGTLHCSRELPDGRDLNRCFPGSRTGTLASRVARFFLREIVLKCTHGIDVHTAGGHRDNLPQIRANLKDPETRRLALVFGAKVAMHADLRDGSLRQEASSRGIPTLLFEGGKPLRHERAVILSAAAGILRVMTELGMIDEYPPPARKSLVAWGSSWVRAPRSGYFIAETDLGHLVEKGQTLGIVVLRANDDLTVRHIPLRAKQAGLVIGIQRLPLVHVGDPLVHLADVRRRKRKGRARREGREAPVDE
jgi:predicted deacylase